MHEEEPDQRVASSPILEAVWIWRIYFYLVRAVQGDNDGFVRRTAWYGDALVHIVPESERARTKSG